MGNLIQDLRYSFRMLVKHPGLTAVALLSLAMGIGANTSIFSVVNAVLLRPLPFKDPDHLMTLFRTESKAGQASSNVFPHWSYPKFEALRDHSQVFEQIAAFHQLALPLTGTDNPERLEVELVSASYFPLLGVQAIVGRTFLPEEDKIPGAHPVALVGHELWQGKFGSDPSLVGKTIHLNQVPLTVVGILPEGFRGQSGTMEMWVPMMMAPALTFPGRLSAPHAHWHEVIARLKPGVGQTRAQAEMDVSARKVEAAFPRPPGMGHAGIKLVPLREAKIDPVIRKSFLILFAAVGFVLLIACANIANVLTAKAASRQKEIAIRLALGAGRGRLIRQLLTESILLALSGGLVGLLVALWGIDLLTAFRSLSTRTVLTHFIQPFEFFTVRIDGHVLVFTLLLSFVTGILFGLIPALEASRPSLNEALKEGSGGSIEGFRKGHRFGPRNLLVVAEIALTLVLLIGAGLMIKSFARTQATKLGFEPNHLLTFRIDLPGRRYSPATAAAFYQQLLDRAAALPGVESASVANSPPLSSFSMTPMTFAGRPPVPSGSEPVVGYHIVDPGYFKMLRIPVLRGRPFTEQDRAGVQRVAIINETAARRFWPGYPMGTDPIGQRIWLAAGWGPRDDFAEIVGVVGDVKYGKVEEAVGPDVYLCYLQYSELSSFVMVRMASDPAALMPALRAAVLALDKNLPIYSVRTMEQRIADATSRTRFSALLLGIFAAMALVLAAVGIYGVMAYAVSGRTREIGIRMALGAEPRDVLKLVMSDGIILTLIGLALGLAAAFATTRVLTSQLYGVGITDPTTFMGVSLLLAGVALLASYIPAHRATKVDPMVALRYE